MVTIWHIRPINDGYTMIKRIENGNHILIEKAGNDIPLYFTTEEEADKYITAHLDPHIYRPEETWVTEGYICPKCGLFMKEQWREAIDQNGEIRRVCHCTNEDCGYDCAVYTDKDYNLLRKERFFFG